MLTVALQRTTDHEQRPFYFKSTDQYALSRNVFQLAYFGLPSLIVSSGLRFGRTGFLISFMPASCGVRPPLRTLHRTHAHTRFSQVVSPPRHVGTMWSRLSSLVAKPLAAVLAEVAVAGKDVAAVQPHALLRHAIVVQQPQHARHLDLEVHAANPVLVRLFELGLQLADFPPRVEVVVGPLVALDVDHFGQPTEQQPKRPPHIDDVNRDVLTIEQQNAGTQGCIGSGRHTRVTPALAFSRVLESHCCMAEFTPRSTTIILITSQPLFQPAISAFLANLGRCRPDRGRPVMPALSTAESSSIRTGIQTLSAMQRRSTRDAHHSQSRLNAEHSECRQSRRVQRIALCN